MLRAPVAQNGNGPFVLVVRLLLVVTLLTGVFSIGGAGAAYASYSQLADSLVPRLDALQNRETFETTRIFDRNGTLLYEFFGAGRRTRVPLDEIAPDLINATIAIEDKSFFENTGVDFRGIVRTLLSSLEAGEEVGGASTITQQLIKGVVLTDEEREFENRYQRKLTEIVLAQELSERYEKETILELYLNEIYYGNLSYGIEAASETYFGKRAKDLNLAEASLLAGLPQLPSFYEPINYLEGNALRGVRVESDWLTSDAALPRDLTPPKWRQIAVLRQMVDQGYATEAEARRVIQQDLPFASQEVPLNAPHFVFHVRKLLEEKYGQNFANEGLSVYTSLDLELQRTVQRLARERIEELQERNIHNAAVVVMQPNTGQILAMVGSIDYNRIEPSRTPGQEGNVVDGQVNVTTRERQPGSALKPFTYVAAMERGMTPASVLWDVPTEFIGGPEPYAPQNYNQRWNGPLRMRTALANSLNMPAVKALKFAGIDYTIDMLHRIGITGLQRGADFYGLSLTLGGGEVTPLDLTTAYNTLASGGYYYPPVAITKVIDGDGRVIEEFQPPERIPVADPPNGPMPPRPGQQVLRAEHVAIITDMMSDDRARQPVWGLNSRLNLSRPAAVKTGTSNDWRDAWAAGYTPFVTVGVWTGNNNNEPTARVESLAGGGIIWHNVMEAMFANPRFEQILAEPYGGQLPLNFEMPATVQRLPMCQLSGPFNAYTQELFSPEMLAGTTNASGAMLQPASTAALQGGRMGCDAYTRVTVVRLDAPQPVADDDGATRSSSYCRPVEGLQVPEDLITTITVWNLPESDVGERVNYAGFANVASELGDDVTAVASSIPACTSEMIATVAPPGAIRMPDLQRFGENQAKEQLAALGITNIYVDYQNRERIPDQYDQFVPYSVVSTLPAAGQWVRPEDLVVLGIRAPDPATEAPPEGEQPPPPEGEQPPPPEGEQPPPPPEGEQPPPPEGEQPPPPGE